MIANAPDMVRLLRKFNEYCVRNAQNLSAEETGLAKKSAQIIRNVFEPIVELQPAAE